ncbi:MAG: hypothetical protein LBI69_04445 [Puniceicoccales bacterium]|nr:hypothetical protein [Puniceicoccales bacterium]
MIFSYVEWFFAILDLTGACILSRRKVRTAYRVWFISNFGIAMCNFYQHEWAFGFLFLGYFTFAIAGYINHTRSMGKGTT